MRPTSTTPSPERPGDSNEQTYSDDSDSIVEREAATGSAAQANLSNQLAALQNIAAELAGPQGAGTSRPHLGNTNHREQQRLPHLPPALQPAGLPGPQDEHDLQEQIAPAHSRPAGALFQPPSARAYTLELPATPHPQLGGNACPPEPTPGTGLPANTPYAAQVLASLEALMCRPMPPPQPATGRPVRQARAAAAAQPTTHGRMASAGVAAATAAAGAGVRRPRTSDPSERRPCNCKRSQCLKLYCECFAAGGFCAGGCFCNNCLNTEEFVESVQAARQAVLQRDPNAFKAKVSATDGHKKGCRCKRSRCLKKYCECYSAGAQCNPEVCICEGCKNGKGRRGPPSVPTEEAAASQAVPKAPATQAQQPPSLNAFPGMHWVPSLATAESGYVPLQFDPAAAAAMFGSMSTTMQTQLQMAAGAGVPFLFSPRAAAGAAQAHAPTHPQQQQQQQPEDKQEDAPALQEAMPAAGDAQTQAQDAATPVEVKPLKPALGEAAAGPNAAASRPAIRSQSALTSHLSDIATGVDALDTACSPAPHLAVGRLAARHRRGPAPAGTMTGGARGAVPLHLRPQLSGGSGESLGSKRPRRAASGGVAGAVAAATSDWGLDVTSPPVKRSNLGVAHRGVVRGTRTGGAPPAGGPAVDVEVEAASALVGLHAA